VGYLRTLGKFDAEFASERYLMMTTANLPMSLAVKEF